MKKLLLIGGLSLISMTSFSQQTVSNTKRVVATPVPEKINSSEELVSDSTSVTMMKRTANQEATVNRVSNEAGSNKEPKPVLNSTLRKPE